jgi:hypothetical protein
MFIKTIQLGLLIYSSPANARPLASTFRARFDDKLHGAPLSALKREVLDDGRYIPQFLPLTALHGWMLLRLYMYLHKTGP